MDPPPEDQNSQQGQGETNLKLFSLKKMRSSMNVGKGIWRPSMLVLIMALIHGSCHVSEVSRGWDEPNSREKGSFLSTNPKSKRWNVRLSEDMDMKAKVATIARRLEELELKKMHEVQAISRPKPMSCHAPFANQEIMWPNNNAPYGNTYNSSWRNHPNFSWKPRPPPYQPQGQTQAPQQTSSGASHCKPKGVFKVEGGKMKNSCQRKPWLKRAITKKRRMEENASKSSIEEEPRIVIKEDMMKKHMPPLSSSFTWKEGNQEFIEILEVLRQVKVNIPLLDMIKQVPTYAKFLKDLCTVNRGLHVTKNAFLTEQVSAIIRVSLR
ncbi:hypothetical protein AAG906_022599 [Vitis piasezkii]